MPRIDVGEVDGSTERTRFELSAVTKMLNDSVPIRARMPNRSNQGVVDFKFPWQIGVGVVPSILFAKIKRVYDAIVRAIAADRYGPDTREGSKLEGNVRLCSSPSEAQARVSR